MEICLCSIFLDFYRQDNEKKARIYNDIDQYNFCHVLGKSGKEPHLVLKDEYKENYLGGAAAISNHVSAFCNEVNFITSLGSRESYLSFIKKNTSKRAENGPKRRFWGENGEI